MALNIRWYTLPVLGNIMLTIMATRLTSTPPCNSPQIFTYNLVALPILTRPPTLHAEIG